MKQGGYDMLESMMGSRDRVKAKIVCWNKVPCLIVSFKDSDPPLVWQMDLEKLTSYSLKLVEKEGEWDLGYTAPDAAFVVVAHFDVRTHAEAAFEAVQAALIKGACAGSSTGRSIGAKVFRTLLLVVFVAILLLFAGSWVASSLSAFLGADRAPAQMVEQKPMTLDDVPPDAAVLKREPKIESGVPMNADDVLPRDVQ